MPNEVNQKFFRDVLKKQKQKNIQAIRLSPSQIHLEDSTIIDELSFDQLETELIKESDLLKTPTYSRSFSKVNMFGRMTPSH